MILSPVGGSTTLCILVFLYFLKVYKYVAIVEKSKEVCLVVKCSQRK